MRISVAIIEDDTLSAQKLSHGLTEFGQRNEHTFSIARFEDGRSFLQNYQPKYDIIFMDIKIDRKSVV